MSAEDDRVIRELEEDLARLRAADAESRLDIYEQFLNRELGDAIQIVFARQEGIEFANIFNALREVERVMVEDRHASLMWHAKGYEAAGQMTDYNFAPRRFETRQLYEIMDTVNFLMPE